MGVDDSESLNRPATLPTILLLETFSETTEHLILKQCALSKVRLPLL